MRDKIVAAIGLVIAFVCIALLSIDPHEGDPLFNCHLHGNHVCGPTAPWHGFVGGEE